MYSPLSPVARRHAASRTLSAARRPTSHHISIIDHMLTSWFKYAISSGPTSSEAVHSGDSVCSPLLSPLSCKVKVYLRPVAAAPPPLCLRPLSASLAPPARLGRHPHARCTPREQEQRGAGHDCAGEAPPARAQRSAASWRRCARQSSSPCRARSVYLMQEGGFGYRGVGEGGFGTVG